MAGKSRLKKRPTAAFRDFYERFVVGKKATDFDRHFADLQMRKFTERMETKDKRQMAWNKVAPYFYKAYDFENVRKSGPSYVLK